MKKLVKWLADMKLWMEKFADKPNAMWWLFFISFIESFIFPIPPDILLIAIAISNPKRAIEAAIWCSAGSVFGGIVGYYIGYAFMDIIGNPIINFYGAQAAREQFINWFAEWGNWILTVAAFTPIPYKISTIAFGAAKGDLIAFIIISTIGRSARFFAIALMIWKFGPQFKAYIDKYFDKLSIAFFALIIFGFLAIKFFI